MRRAVPGGLLLALAALAAACGTDRNPAPTAVAAPPIRLATQAIECDPSGIRAAGGSSITTSEWKRTGQPLFNSAQQAEQAGNTTLATTLYYEVLDFLVGIGKAGNMVSSNAYPNPADALHFMMASVIDCAGDPYPDELATVVAQIYDSGDEGYEAKHQYQICVALDIGAAIECRARNQRAGTRLEANFLTREALIIFEPTNPGLAIGSQYGSIWSEAWDIEVHPSAAQANAPGQAPGLPGQAQTASVALCTRAHDYLDPVTLESASISHGSLNVATAPEGANASGLVTRLPTDPRPAVVGLISCDETTAPTQVAVAPALGGSRVARQLWSSVQAAGATVGRWLAPQPLYAWDGGAGGGLLAFESTFGTVVPLQVSIRRPEAAYGPVSTWTLPRGTSYTFQASQSRFGALVAPASCTWASSHNRVRYAASGAGNATVVLTAGNSAGTATVTATCTRSDGVTEPASIVVTVQR